MAHHEAPQRSDALVMFGLTGDLGQRKLFPAIYEMAVAGVLGVPVIGVGRSEFGDDDLREMFRRALTDHDPADGSKTDLSIIDEVDLSYLSGDSTDADTFDRIIDRLGHSIAPLVYAALPPDLFGGVAGGMAASNFPEAARLMVEKPFGEDVETACRLWENMTEHVPTDRLFVVDHFLAKSAVENIAVVRHANALIANNLDRHHVASIEIEMSESGDVDGRGSFYEGVGAVDDVVQSHLMQTAALALMEAPAGSSADDFRRERSMLLADVKPVDTSTVLLGQYDGYRSHDGVADDSTVETYVSMRLDVDNERWRGVPVTITTGKNLAHSSTSVTYHLSASSSPTAMPNSIRFEIKPAPAVSLELGTLDPNSHEPQSTVIHACGPEQHGRLGDYATLFDNALDGEHQHFAHIDGIIESWRILAPMQGAELPLYSYAPGSDGPSETTSRTV